MVPEQLNHFRKNELFRMAGRLRGGFLVNIRELTPYRRGHAGRIHQFVLGRLVDQRASSGATLN
jgi:hypothetical protein